MIRQTDLLIKSTVEMVIRDMRDNPYLIDDVFADLLEDPYLKDYYAKDVENAKKWFLNTDIKVLLRLRGDTQEFPCVTISLGGGSEDQSKGTLSDVVDESEEFAPSEIGKPIGYVVKPFVPISYDKDQGLITVPEDLDIRGINIGQKLVNPDTGDAWEITSLEADQGFFIAADTELIGSTFGIIPQYMKYKAQREAAWFKQTFSIGCHVSDDPSSLIWLHSIILYGLQRHKELLHSRCFSQLTVSYSDLNRANGFQPAADNAMSRYIELSGFTRHTWLKSPKRYIEQVVVDPINYQVETDTPQDVADPDDDGWDTVLIDQPSNRKIYRR